MSLAANADIFGPGREALALARKAFGGRGFFVPAPSSPPDFVRVPYTFGEPEVDRHRRLTELAETLSRAVAMESTEAEEGTGRIIPTPVGEPQGLDTIAFFTACRVACPQAHLVVDLELLGHKLGQLCLSFGADEIMGSIVDRRELRLGARAGSNELTRDEAAQLLRASGFDPCERSPDGKVPKR